MSGQASYTCSMMRLCTASADFLSSIRGLDDVELTGGVGWSGVFVAEEAVYLGQW